MEYSWTEFEKEWCQSLSFKRCKEVENCVVCQKTGVKVWMKANNEHFNKLFKAGLIIKGRNNS